MVDLMHDLEPKKRYETMNVPRMAVDDSQVCFGRKGLEEMVRILETV